METRVNYAVSSLRSGFDDDVGMIGIKGMGGGGKTTLARAVLNQIYNQFQGKCFIENVSSVHDGKNIIKRLMRSRKVLVVLDDVDHIDQLEALVGESNWFKPGSTVIFTTRDEQVLVAHGMKLICNVKLLSDTEGICLFNRYAFGRVIPIERYTRLSKQVIHYAGGLPLTIRVLGSFLCGKNELEWMDAIERLKIIPLMETMKKLELSYIGLEEDYKEIFLDVACLLQGEPKHLALEALESYGFYARNGLRVLEQRSLITIDGKHMGMHDYI
ncbi:TMV resistance protein N-like [Lactuca sativa]|uniref:TMV resistance protein N-like n=1 Tax=Lactuca sativa TaxID=4236 RepID=UPI000CD80727|nr:TMV resistance protein N-like [Lactuca sativa]